MKKINLLYLLAILAIISGLLLYYLPDIRLDIMQSQIKQVRLLRRRRLSMILVRQS